VTVDEIHRVYDDAYKQYQREPVNGWSAEKAERFALCSVVRALRDELNRVDWDLHESAIEVFDQILGSGAGEKVAGGSTREDEQSCNSSDGSSPATDAAPAVCVWTPYTDENLGANWWRSCGGVRHRYSFDGHHPCASCGKPIKFTEAK